MYRNDFTETLTNLLGSLPNAIFSPVIQWERDKHTAELAELQMQHNHEERMAVLEIIKESIEQGHIIADDRFILTLLLNQDQRTSPTFLIE